MRQAKESVSFAWHLGKLGESMECLQKLSHLAARTWLLAAEDFLQLSV